MSTKASNIMSTYATWLIANYQAICRINSFSASLRLVSHDLDKAGTVYFTTQVVGKNIFPKFSLEELQKPVMLNNFCKNDQKIICYYIQQTRFQATKSIVARTYDMQKKRFVFTIESIDQKRNLKQYSIVDDIKQLLDDIHCFDSKDAFLINLDLKN